MATDLVKKAGKRFGEVIAVMGKNYLASAVANGLKPVIIAAISEALDDAKSSVGMNKEEEKKDSLGDSKGAEQPDLFSMDLDSVSVIHTGWSYSFTAYTLYCIRVGTDKNGAFFALGKKYQIAYNTLRNMHFNVLKKEFGDKVPVIPPDCLHGTYCLCLTRKSDLGGTEHAMRTYIRDVAKQFGHSKDLASYFYLGDKWEIQQQGKLIFDEAFKETRASQLRGEYYREIDPFDEGEALTQLLRSVARNEVVPDVRRAVWKIPVCQWRFYYAADQLVLSSIDTAMAAGWPPAQIAVNKGKEAAIEAINKGAEKLVEQLKPVLKKILELVQSKLNKKEEKKDKEKEKEEKKKAEIGDVVANWRFERCDIGKTFHDGLGEEDARAALNNLSNHLNTAIEKAVEARLAEGAKKLLGDKANLEIVQIVIENVADQAVRLIRKFTTIGPLMTASKTFFDVRADFEKNLIAARGSGADAVIKVIDEGSASFWKTLPHIGLVLYKDMDRVKENISSEMRNCSAEAVAPLTDVADQLYARQMKALNSLRTQLVNQLKVKASKNLSSDDALKAALRSTFREITFNVVQILVSEAWTAVGNAMVQSAVQQVLDKFYETVWPTIAQGLEAIQNLIPEPVANMGLKIEPLARKVVDVILTKGTTWVVTKIIIKLEQILFTQE